MSWYARPLASCTTWGCDIIESVLVIFWNTKIIHKHLSRTVSIILQNLPYQNISKVNVNVNMTSVSTDDENRADATTSVPSSSTQDVQMNADRAAQTIKDAARRIREESARMRETVKTIRQSGAIEELAAAVREAAIAARYTSKEVSMAAR
jgi:hypothetical protein